MTVLWVYPAMLEMDRNGTRPTPRMPRIGHEVIEGVNCSYSRSLWVINDPQTWVRPSVDVWSLGGTWLTS